MRERSSPRERERKRKGLLVMRMYPWTAQQVDAIQNSSPCVLFHGQKPKKKQTKKPTKPNLPLLEFPIINQQLSVVLCLETSSDVNTLNSMSDILDFAVLFYIVVGMLLLLLSL
jgi:hypothetical protein